MRKIFSAVVFSMSVLFVAAQDANSTSSDSITSVPRKVNPLLYNYTSGSINNLFNENMRTGASNRITVDFDYAANSKTVPAALPFNMIFRREIPKSLKDRVDGRVKDDVRFEDMMRTGITLRKYFKKWDGEAFFSYSHRQMRIINMHQETFQVIFYGNARFENDTADFSDFLFNNYIYNQYTGGIRKTIDYGRYQMQFGVGLSLLQVINQQEIKTGDSYLYTAPDGEFLEFNYDLTFNNAREGATGFGQMNGIGGSGDLNIGFSEGNKWKLTIDLSDVGYVTFRKNPVNYSAAKTVRFHGIGLPDLLSFSSQTFDTLALEDSVRAFLPTKTDREYSLFIPFTATVVFSKPLLKDKLVLSAGLQYRHIPGYYVYGYLKANYFIKPDMVFSASAGAGGYSLFNLGVEFSKSWKYFDFAVGSSNLIGLVAPSHYNGTGLYLRLATSF